MSRNTTDNALSFSTFFLHKYRMLVPECQSFNSNVIWYCNGSETARINYNISTITSNSFIELRYKIKRCNDEEWKPIEQKIQLESVQCHFGGKRWYFRCGLSRNGQYCGRRVAVLYQADNYFGCRHCANLSYESCNESKRMRGFPWKTLSDTWKADEIYKTLKRTHYNRKPTRKYRKCLELWGRELEGTNAEEQLFNSYNK